VQSCGEAFGAEEGTKRIYEKKKAAFIHWHLSRIINRYISCAAILSEYEPESCIQKVNVRILAMLDRDEFVEKARKKSVEIGISITNEVNEVKPDVSNLIKKLHLDSSLNYEQE
jgi:hypothetical protein